MTIIEPAPTPAWVTVHINGYVETHDTMPSYDDLRKAVRGYIESVPLNRAGRSLTAFCNETGKLDGMRPNSPAHAILRDLYLGDDFVVGPVVFTGAADSEGELTPLRDEDWSHMLAILDGFRGFCAAPPERS